jgi:hypothetical protein
VRTTVRLQRLGRGRHAFYRVGFRAPLRTKTTRERYFVSFAAVPHGTGNSCTKTFRFRGFDTDYDVRRGRRLSFLMTPAIAGRWHQGWCPGHYHGGVYFIDTRLPVGEFAFTVR